MIAELTGINRDGVLFFLIDSEVEQVPEYNPIDVSDEELEQCGMPRELWLDLIEALK